MTKRLTLFKVGLTGGIGSGKTAVARCFAAHGVPIVDTDVIAHQLTAPGGAAMPAIISQFGTAFVRADGSLNRNKMREHIYSHAAAKQQLEAITHPLIRAAAELEMREANGPYLICVVPLLVEAGDWRTRFNRILVVDCPLETQIARVMQRNGFSREQVLSIIAHQATREARCAAADDIILNDTSKMDDIARDVDALHRHYLALAST